MFEPAVPEVLERQAAQGRVVQADDGRFELALHQHGLLRPLTGAELSDGTLRYLFLVAALLSPRPPALLVLNEPETSLHPDLLRALGALVHAAARETQVVVVTHAAPLVAALRDATASGAADLPGPDDLLEVELVRSPFGETTVAGLMPNAIMNNGEACVAQTRILASRSRYDDVVDAVATAAAAMKVGDPLDPETAVGPMFASRHRDRVEGYIAKGRDEGARVVTGGGRPPGLDKGWYVEPTIFADVDNGMTIAQEEIFGPVLAVIPYDDVDDALTALEHLAPAFAPGARIVLEHAARRAPRESALLATTRTRAYGDTALAFLAAAASPSPDDGHEE